MGGEPSISYRTFVPLRKLSFCLIASNVTLLVWKRFDNEPGEWTTGQHRKYNNDINNVARNYEAHWAFVSHRNKIFLFIVDPLPHFPFFFFLPLPSFNSTCFAKHWNEREREMEDFRNNTGWCFSNYEACFFDERDEIYVSDVCLIIFRRYGIIIVAVIICVYKMVFIMRWRYVFVNARNMYLGNY